jgi:hypothetical protein
MTHCAVVELSSLDLAITYQVGKRNQTLIPVDWDNGHGLAEASGVLNCMFIIVMCLACKVRKLYQQA